MLEAPSRDALFGWCDEPRSQDTVACIDAANVSFRRNSRSEIDINCLQGGCAIDYDVVERSASASASIVAHPLLLRAIPLQSHVGFDDRVQSRTSLKRRDLTQGYWEHICG